METVVYGEDYKRPYYQCPNCDFLFSTGFDDLSPQDFSKCMAPGSKNNVDMMINRGIRETSMVSSFFDLLGMSRQDPILVYGCGAGLSVNLMLQSGANVYASDLSVQFKDSLKLFDKQLFKPELLPDMYHRFITPEDDRKFKLITLTEVFEHFLDPVNEVKKLLDMLEPGGAIIGTTGWVNKAKGDLKTWWYVVQAISHLTFLSSKSFQLILEAHGCYGTLFPSSQRILEYGNLSAEQCMFLIQKPE